MTPQITPPSHSKMRILIYFLHLTGLQCAHTHLGMCSVFFEDQCFIYFFKLFYFSIQFGSRRSLCSPPPQYFQWAYSPKKLWELQVCTDAHSAKSHHSFHTTCTPHSLEKAFRKTMQDHFYSHNRLNRSSHWFSIHNSLSLLGENQVFQLLE